MKILNETRLIENRRRKKEQGKKDWNKDIEKKLKDKKRNKYSRLS